MNVLISSCTHWWNAEAHYAAVLCETLRAAGHGAWILTQPGTRHATELAKRGMPIITDIAAWEPNPLHWPHIVQELRERQARLSIDVVNVFRSREFLPHALAVRGPVFRSFAPVAVRNLYVDTRSIVGFTVLHVME